MSDFISLLCILLLALPASAILAIGIMIVDAAIANGAGFYLAIIYGIGGLVLTECVIYILNRSNGFFLQWTTAEWARYIRIAQATGVGCIALIYFVM